MISGQYIKKLAENAGFDLCGITPCKHLAENESYFREWLAKGYGSSLEYLERNLDKRFDVRHLVEGAQTVVVCAVSYKNPLGEGYPPGCRTKIASYARSRDYHPVLKRMLGTMLEALRRQYPGLTGRTFVDTAPLLEKQLAVEAGLGWIGRQSLLVTPRFGTYVLLGELLLTDDADAYDPPFEGSRCGRCHNCIESCPTGAIVAPKVIDTGRCISCHTIEKEPTEGIGLDGWIFGCDRCQSCCPHNQKAPMHTNPAFDPVFDPLAMDAEAWLAMDETEFEARMGTTPLTRSGLARIRSNIAGTPGPE
jgi:epoxyqueuosine reductase